VLLFGARTQADLYDLDEINEIAANGPDPFTFVPVLSHEPETSSWTGRRGLVTEAIADHLPTDDLARLQAYMCGPPPMIDAAVSVLTQRGLPLAAIHYDKFTDASYIARAPL
jgi:p-cymene monooxygenase electron transfer component